MREKYDASQVSRIIDQSLVYQCACPAQVCRAIFELRELHRYQLQCINSTDADVLVHRAIADAAEQSHVVMEDCLTRVLEIEGWDPATLTMPDRIRDKQRKAL
jgi:hypothetical protein